MKWFSIPAIAATFVAVSSLAQQPAQSLAGCATWIVLAVLFELLSILGFTVVFKLVFGEGMSRRQNAVAGLRALGASTVLPAGGLVGPAIGTRSTRAERGSLAPLTQSAVAFTVITNVPGLLVLGVLGVSLWLGWPAGPHCASLTLPAAGLALAVFATGLMMRGSLATERPPDAERPRTNRRRIAACVTAACGGLGQASRLLAAGSWRLAGALGYYAFDNAVLWAAFRAHGSGPPASVIVMGYLVGSLATALPLPAGVGVVDGGLIGALVLYGAPAAPAAAAVLSGACRCHFRSS
jgi:uncharacterized membrane protein YbhN (UPF0104 family)